MNVSSEFLARPRIGRLDTVAGWRREIGRVYRHMRRGDIAPADATKMAFVADVGARLCRVEQELAELSTMNAKLTAIEQQPQTMHQIPAPEARP